jgi:hypothetical protein
MLYVQALKTFHINNIFLDLNQNESKLNVIPIILYVLTNRVGYFLIIFAAINNQNLFSMKKIISICFACLLFSSCATLFTGSRQAITFDAKMPEVGIYKDGVKLGETKNDGTFTTKIGKELSSVNMMAKKEGYKNEPFFLNTRFNGVSCINLLNIIAWAIDLGTGNACKYDRNYVEIEMEKE